MGEGGSGDGRRAPSGAARAETGDVRAGDAGRPERHSGALVLFTACLGSCAVIRASQKDPMQRHQMSALRLLLHSFRHQAAFAKHLLSGTKTCNICSE